MLFLIATFAKAINVVLKGIFEGFKYQFLADFKNRPMLRGLFILVFFLLFSFFPAQDSLLAKISSETQITVIGKAQIYSSDQSFNRTVASRKVHVAAVVEHNPEDNSIVITSVGKPRSLSEEAKIATAKSQLHLDKSVSDTLEKIEEKAALNRIFINSYSSDEFFRSGSASYINFIVPDFHNFAHNSFLTQSAEVADVLNLFFEHNKFYFNTRSKTFGYSKTYSLRPPPLLS